MTRSSSRHRGLVLGSLVPIERFDHLIDVLGDREDALEQWAADHGRPRLQEIATPLRHDEEAGE